MKVVPDICPEKLEKHILFKKQITLKPKWDMHFTDLSHIAPGYRHTEARSKRDTCLATGNKILLAVEISQMAFWYTCSIFTKSHCLYDI